MTAQDKLNLVEDLTHDIDRILKDAHDLNRPRYLYGLLDEVVKALADALSDANRIANNLRSEAYAESERDLEAARREYYRSVVG